jgi:hypothetical protein
MEIKVCRIVTGKQGPPAMSPSGAVRRIDRFLPASGDAAADAEARDARHMLLLPVSCAACRCSDGRSRVGL